MRSKLQARVRKVWGVGLGAGLLGALVLAFRYALRPSSKPQLPAVDLIDLEFERQLAEVTQPVTLVWGNRAKYPPIERANGLRLAAAHGLENRISRWLSSPKPSRRLIAFP